MTHVYKYTLAEISEIANSILSITFSVRLKSSSSLPLQKNQNDRKFITFNYDQFAI